ncbi:hypothetical protein HPB49_024640 [Dermacentor silvarum]|uniref:Uncharacterized protein n=1 Tax=Dermacentor silvarum TaxID=543639 RepID=A0ACB8E4B9_DERSI|nr:hypothetical protein HPB49_024640 [Dermacentor silvarum]
MAAKNVYVVCGFCPELDWKPTAFVGPIPPCKVYCWSSCCNKTGTVSAMLEHYEKDCPYRTGPPRYQKEDVECGLRHMDLKHASEAGHEQSTQSALELNDNSMDAMARKGEPLKDSDAESIDDLVEDKSAVGSIKISHSIKLSTTHSEPHEGMHTSIHISVNTSAIDESTTSGFADNDPSSTQSIKAVQEEADLHTQIALKHEHAHDDVEGIQQSNTKHGTNGKANERQCTDANHGGHIDENATFRARTRIQNNAGCTSREHCKQGTNVKEKEASGVLSTNAVPLRYDETGPSVGDAEDEPHSAREAPESARREGSLEAQGTAKKMDCGDYRGSTWMKYCSQTAGQARVQVLPRVNDEGAATTGNNVRWQCSGAEALPSDSSARVLSYGYAGEIADDATGNEEKVLRRKGSVDMTPEQSHDRSLQLNLSRSLSQYRTCCESVKEKNADSSLCKTKPAVLEKSDEGEALLLRGMPETKTGHIGALQSMKLDLETALAATKECIEKHPEDVASLRKHEEIIRECIYEVVNACKAILQASLKASESCEWYVENYDQVKKKALQHECCSVGSSSPLYLRGYNIKPSVLLRKRKGLTEFHAELTLYKGLYDDFVRWPFQEICKLTLLHPSDVTKNIVFCMTGDNEPGYIAYLKPRGMKNVSVHANEHRSLQEIEEGGFISDNKLHFRFEVSRV